MIKNSLFRQTFQRKNLFKEFIYNFVYGICSYPRLLIECMTRTNFGELYFNFASVLTVAAILFLTPIVLEGPGTIVLDAVTEHWTWYTFIAVFVYFGNKRRVEMKRNPSAFDFEKFPYSLGYNHPLYEGTLRKIFGYKIDNRVYEPFIEPLPFLLAGVVLAMMHQLVGILLILSAICYSVSYLAAYHIADLALLEQIAVYIYNKNMKAMFVDEKHPSQTQGAYFLGRRPRNLKDKEQLLKMMMAEDEGAPVI